MATRVIPPRILKKLRYNTATKPFQPHLTSPALSPPNILDQKPPSSATTLIPPAVADINFHDVEKLFSYVPTSKLLRSTAVLHATAVEPLVDLGTWIMRSDLMQTNNPVKDLALSATRATFFDHFCAGEDAATAGKSIAGLNEAGLRGMLVYGIEDAHDNDACDRNLKAFLHTVDVSRSLPPSSVSFNIVKITAICPMSLLERMSDLLRWQKKDPSMVLPWKQDSLPIFSDLSPLYHTRKRPEPLTAQEERDLELANKRFQELCEKCVQCNIPLLVDAEFTSVQPAIDYFTYAAAIVHNKGENPIVFGTMQTYLKDAKDRLLLTSKAADKMGIPMGFKLVRGAYMSSERKLAADLGKLAAAKAHELGMGKVNHKMEFAQLYGMSEALSFGLSNAGFQVSKYMPFGPVETVMPYLLRRAEENRGVLAASGFDRKLMRKELFRRAKSAVF
ncbi:hypothetical protein TSUD_169050 [Trifolium subterraneum]|nr:hypothetical protein TSUD_169050 [Trifolium subterraneum]